MSFSFFRWIIGATIIIACVGAFIFFLFIRETTPDLNRPFTPPARLPQSLQDEAKLKVEDAISQLTNDPGLISQWLQLAVYRKSADDLEGAEEIWLYVKRKWPEDPVAYNNLADLYQNHFGKPRLAERNWEELIALRPDFIPAYRNLHDLYRYKLQDMERARGILLQGLSVNENEIDLLIPLAVFLRDRGEKEEALRYFADAKKQAELIGKTDLAGLIAGDIEQLMKQ